MKLKLKLRRKHPNNFTFFGDHVVTPHAQEFDLSETEVKLLETTGPKHWIEVYEEKKEEPKKKQSKKKVSKKGK